MATIVQLDPPIPMTAKHPISGELDGFEAQFLIDRGLERYTYFLGCFDSDGTYWELDNTEVRACRNVTIGRTMERGAAAPAAAPRSPTESPAAAAAPGPSLACAG